MLKQQTCSAISGRSGGGAWVCEACERAPPAFLCRADSASLCAACDAEVHSANPLASRHHRVPINGCLRDPSVGAVPTDDELFPDEEGEDDSASWLLLNPVKNDGYKLRNIEGLVGCGGGGGEVDEYLDLEEYNQFGEDDEEFNFIKKVENGYSVDFDDEKSYGGGDGVVPVTQGRNYMEQMQSQANFQMGMDYECSETGYNFSSSISRSVSAASLPVGVVPESAGITAAASQCRAGKGTIDLFTRPSPTIQMGAAAVVAAAAQLSGAEREARVLRYREKKKARKFEKTIRYASRKAYAESRPRIKGRFAKRNDAVQADERRRMFSSGAGELVAGSTAYGIAPSF